MLLQWLFVSFRSVAFLTPGLVQNLIDSCPDLCEYSMVGGEPTAVDHRAGRARRESFRLQIANDPEATKQAAARHPAISFALDGI